jgi:putative DNA primase/helicase
MSAGDFSDITRRLGREKVGAKYKKIVEDAMLAQNGNYAPDRFIPSTEWQEVPDWAVLPNGGEYRVDTATGKSWARWNDPVPGPEMVIDRRHAKAKPEPQQDPVPETEPEIKENASPAPTPVPPSPRPASTWPTDSYHRPGFLVHHGWNTSPDDKKHRPGTYYHGADIDKKTGSSIPYDEWVCAPLDVLAITRDREDGDYGKLLGFKSWSRQKKEWAMPLELLSGQGEGVLAELYREGLDISYSARKLLLQYIATQHTDVRKFCATTTGWYDDATFVLPSEVIGGSNNSICFQSATRQSDYGHSGTLDEWKTKVALLAVGNPNMVFAISGSLSGPLLRLANLPGGGLHWYGDSTIGKTTGLDAGTSVWGGERFKRSWKTTVNGLESIAALHTDTALHLDEIDEANAKDLDQATYSLANGCGKSRANRSGGSRAPARWRVFSLSSGEIPISTKLASAGINTKAGQALRFLDMPTTGKYGAFDNLHGYPTGGAFSDAVRNAAAKFYGHAGPEFVRCLIKHAQDPAGLDLGTHLDAAMKKVWTADKRALNDQERRACRMFALVGVAGELAILSGITPWPLGEAISAAKVLFKRWLDNRENTDGQNTEHAAVLRTINDFINLHGTSRFSNINPAPGDREPQIRDRAGYWDDSDDRIYLFTSTGLKEATKAYDFRRVLKALSDTRAFTKSGPNDERAAQARTPENKNTWFYHIDPTKLV